MKNIYLIFILIFALIVASAHAAPKSSTKMKKNKITKSKKLNFDISVDESIPAAEDSTSVTDLMLNASYQLTKRHKIQALQFLSLPSEVEKGEDKVQPSDIYLYHHYKINKKFTYRSTLTLPASETTKDHGKITFYEARLYYKRKIAKRFSLSATPIATYYFNEYNFSPVTQKKNKLYGIGAAVSLSYVVSDKLSFNGFYLTRLDWEEKSRNDVSDTNQTSGTYWIDLNTSYRINKKLNVRVGYKKIESQRSDTVVEYVFYRPEASEYYLGLDYSF